MLQRTSVVRVVCLPPTTRCVSLTRASYGEANSWQPDGWLILYLNNEQTIILDSCESSMSKEGLLGRPGLARFLAKNYNRRVVAQLRGYDAAATAVAAAMT